MTQTGAGKDFSYIETNFYRIISTKYPREDLYEDLCSSEHFNIATQLESRTNPRVLEATGKTKVIKNINKYTGPKEYLVNTPFLDLSQIYPSRFSTVNFGVFYCAKEYECAVEETKYHTLNLFKDANNSSAKTQKRVLVGKLAGLLFDITKKNLPEIYSTIDYAESQKLGLQIKKDEKGGIVYDSVRYKGGTCYAIFKPNIIESINENEKCLEYELIDGKIKVTEIPCKSCK